MFRPVVHLPRHQTDFPALYFGKIAENRHPGEAGQLMLPTKKQSGAIGHPFVELGSLLGLLPHELLGPHKLRPNALSAVSPKIAACDRPFRKARRGDFPELTAPFRKAMKWRLTCNV